MARSTAIDRLRGWAFLMVFCGHVFLANLGGGAWLLAFDPVYGVSLFFSISGALVGSTLLASSRPHAIINSTVRRVIRLSLPHAVALLAYAAIGQARLFESLDLPASPADGVGDLLISGSLLFGALPTTGGVNLVVPGNWSISAELLAALVLLPLLARLCRDERSAFWVFIVGSVAGGVLASVLRQTSSNLIFWAPLHIGAFAGGWWALLRSRRSDPLSLSERVALEISFVTLLFSMILIPSTSPALAGLIGALLVWRALRAEQRSRSLVSRSLAWFGSRSYGAYLAHFPGYLYGQSIARALELPGLASVGLSIVSGLLGAAVIGALFSRWVDAPSAQLGKRLADWFVARIERRYSTR